MPASELPPNTVPYLAERFRRGDMLLFTGAGFSRAAQNLDRDQFPLLNDLRPVLWDLCYPGEPIHPSTAVQSLFSTAKARAGGKLKSLLQRKLMAVPEGVPSLYDELFAVPWHRVYTLNVDNLDTIVAARSGHERRVRPISALRTSRERRHPYQSDLEVIHLNGMISDAPELVTFSMEQYAERLQSKDAFYIQCAADLAAMPAVFIGTPLDESPLWAHIQLRSRGVERAYRKRSFLVSPDLDPARAETLHRELNVEHIPLTTEQFHAFLKDQLSGEIDAGRQSLRVAAESASRRRDVPLLSELRTVSPPPAREYLLGTRPTIADVVAGRSAERDQSSALRESIQTRLGKSSQDGVLVLCGTAGSGKSTCLMQVGLAIEAAGRSVGWLDSDSEISAREIVRALSSNARPSVLLVDDATGFGRELASGFGELRSQGHLPVVIIACRTFQADSLSDSLRLSSVDVEEFQLANLSDGEIARLIDILDRENRLGVLKGLDQRSRMDRFRAKAGRQLIVAMLEATSGKPFRDMLVSELDGLEGEARTVYALTAISTSLGFGVTLPELLIAINGANDKTHRSIESLQRRLLLTKDARGEFRVRHPVISEVLLEAIITDGAMPELLSSLAVAFAAVVDPSDTQRSRSQRRMRRLMNHDFLFERLGIVGAANLFDAIESFLSWDSHFWLQRGSFELEHGSLDRAENFLGSAISLAPGDNLCKTEFGYLRLRQAVNSPSAEASRALLEEGFALLQEAILGRQKLDPHQYHILASQLVAWTRRSDITRPERMEWLTHAETAINEGKVRFPRNEMIRQAWVAVQSERLELA